MKYLDALMIDGKPKAAELGLVPCHYIDPWSVTQTPGTLAIDCTPKRVFDYASRLPVNGAPVVLALEDKPIDLRYCPLEDVRRTIKRAAARATLIRSLGHERVINYGETFDRAYQRPAAGPGGVTWEESNAFLAQANQELGYSDALCLDYYFDSEDAPTRAAWVSGIPRNIPRVPILRAMQGVRDYMPRVILFSPIDAGDHRELTEDEFLFGVNAIRAQCWIRGGDTICFWHPHNRDGRAYVWDETKPWVRALRRLTGRGFAGTPARLEGAR